MKKFHVFVWPYDTEGLSATTEKYYRGSVDTLKEAMQMQSTTQGCCEILKTQPNGSLKIVRSAYEVDGHWSWFDEKGVWIETVNT